MRAEQFAQHAAVAAHGLHHVRHLAVHLEQLVDVFDLGAGAGRDAALALGVENFRVAALLRRHRRDDGALVLEELSSRPASSIWPLILATPGSMPMHAAHAADLLHLLQLIGEVFEVERRPSSSSRRSSSPSRRRSFCAAFSTRLTTSPMPRMRPAMRRDGSPRARPTFRRRR